MRRKLFYLSVTLLAFGFGSFGAAVFYFKANINADSVKDPTVRHMDWVNKTINQIESENTGFDELVTVKNRDSATVQGYIDIKFLCPDVTDIQKEVCTTILIGGSTEKKSLLIRLPVCSDLNKSSCIVWKPDNLCDDGILCSNKIKIYDKNSNPVELVRRYQHYDNERNKHFWTSDYHNIQLKVTGKVLKIEDKAYLKNPIDSIEIMEKDNSLNSINNN